MQALGEAFAKWSPQQQFLLAVVAGAVFLVMLVLMGLWLFSLGRMAVDGAVLLVRGDPNNKEGGRLGLPVKVGGRAQAGECPNRANRTGKCLNPFFECMTATQCDWLINEVNDGNGADAFAELRRTAEARLPAEPPKGEDLLAQVRAEVAGLLEQALAGRASPACQTR